MSVQNVDRVGWFQPKMNNREYRHGYLSAHTQAMLARQMRGMRGEMSQTEFGLLLGVSQTQVARFENPRCKGWSLRTMLKIANKLDVGLIVRFGDFGWFIRESGKLGPRYLKPKPWPSGVKP